METNILLKNRGYEKHLVLLPGWAMDYRIFNPLNLPYNYIYPINFDPDSFPGELSSFTDKNKISKVDLFGFSMGAFCALDIARTLPERIEKILLGGIRKSYPKESIHLARENILKNPKAYLQKFYSLCFSDRKNFREFKSLLGEYAETMAPKRLLETLSYLESRNALSPEPLKNYVSIFHGENDLIAPESEAREVASSLPESAFTSLKNAGHLFFLETKEALWFPEN